MGKAQFTKIVSAFEHSMAGSAQEKLRQRSDLGLWWSRLSRRLCKNKGMHCRTRGRQPPVWRTVFRRKGSLSQLSRSVASATQLNKPLIKFCLQRQFVRRPSPPSRVLLRATQWGVSQKLRCVVADRAAEPDQDFASSYYESSEGQKRSEGSDLLSEVEQRSLRVQGGGGGGDTMSFHNFDNCNLPLGRPCHMFF